MEECRRGRLDTEEQRSTFSSLGVLRNKRCRSGVCWGAPEEARAGVEVLWRRVEEGGVVVLQFSSGGQRASRPPQSSDSVFLLGAEPERHLLAERCVLTAASIFLSNTRWVS